MPTFHKKNGQNLINSIYATSKYVSGEWVLKPCLIAVDLLRVWSRFAQRFYIEKKLSGKGLLKRIAQRFYTEQKPSVEGI